MEQLSYQSGISQSLCLETIPILSPTNLSERKQMSIFTKARCINERCNSSSRSIFLSGHEN